MGLFIGILLFFWLISLGAFFLFTRWFRTSDMDKMKSRLMGTPKKEEKQTLPRSLYSMRKKRRRDRLSRG